MQNGLVEVIWSSCQFWCCLRCTECGSGQGVPWCCYKMSIRT